MEDKTNSSNIQLKSYLGRGWKFPVTFVKGGNSVVLVEDEEDIRESLIILLSTALGERIMQSDYGANLDDLLFESINVTTLTILTKRLERAIMFNEPRIKVSNVNIIPQSAEGRIDIQIEYSIRSNNSRWNLVYPFYLNEGTNVKQ